MEKIKIILVDDHQIVRDGIKSLLQREEFIFVIGEASNHDELYSILSGATPDLILMDISLPGYSGIELTKRLSETHPDISVIILSMHVNDEFVMNAISAGVSGYLPKNTSKKELLDAVRSVYEGNSYFPPSIASLVFKRMVKAVRSDKAESDKQSLLTKREIEILLLIADGMTNKEIADKLFISNRTVESHKNHIMQKLQLRSPVDLVKFALSLNEKNQAI